MIHKYGGTSPKLVVNLPGNVYTAVAGKDSKKGDKNDGTEQQKYIGRR